jgi:TRAP-type C4-dicarboxylate transport system permease small subunit
MLSGGLPMHHKPPLDLVLPLRIAVSLALIVVVGVTLAQIGLRYLFAAPLPWSEQLARLLTVWITFIGAAAVCWDGRHLNVDVVFIKLPPRAQNLLRLVNAAISIGFLAVLGWTSVKLVRIESVQMMSVLPLPAGAPRAAVTVGAALMIAAILGRIFYVRPRHRRIDPGYGHEDAM